MNLTLDGNYYIQEQGQKNKFSPWKIIVNVEQQIAQFKDKLGRTFNLTKDTLIKQYERIEEKLKPVKIELKDIFERAWLKTIEKEKLLKAGETTIKIADAKWQKIKPREQIDQQIKTEPETQSNNVKKYDDRFEQSKSARIKLKKSNISLYQEVEYNSQRWTLFPSRTKKGIVFEPSNWSTEKVIPYAELEEQIPFIKNIKVEQTTKIGEERKETYQEKINDMGEKTSSTFRQKAENKMFKFFGMEKPTPWAKRKPIGGEYDHRKTDRTSRKNFWARFANKLNQKKYPLTKPQEASIIEITKYPPKKETKKRRLAH